MDESDDEVEEEVPAPAPTPPPPPQAVPTKPTYIVEAACKRFEVPQEAVLFSAYRPIAVKDGALMGSITASNSPSVWSAAGASWKNLVRIGWTIEDTLFEGLFVTFSCEANPDSSDPRFLRRITTAPTKQFVSELANLGEKASIKYKNLCEYNIDSPKLVSSTLSTPIPHLHLRCSRCVCQDPVAARFRQLSRDESEQLAVAFRYAKGSNRLCVAPSDLETLCECCEQCRSKPKASPAVAKKPAAAAPAPEPSDEDAPAITNGKRPHSGTHINLNIDSHCLIPRDLFEQLYKDSLAYKKLKGRSE